MFINIPKNVKLIIDTLYKNGFEGFMVGGCVRDSLLNLIPHDYDITTSAMPENTLTLFDKTIPTGLQHGTVTVVIDKEHFELTTYRTEEKYINNRKPEKVNFVTNIDEDLSRRDFTINAFAYNDKVGLLDFFNGKSDLENKVIRCVGDADTRFQEDALRMLRAIRFSCQLDFNIEDNTFNAIKRNHKLINNISKERIRDELSKILLSQKPSKGIEALNNSNLLKEILPEVCNLVDFYPACTNHNKNVFKHTLKVIDNIDSNDLNLKLSALLHDIGKFTTLTKDETNGFLYFPNHNIDSFNMSKDILTRLRFDNKTINTVLILVKYHMCFTCKDYPSRKDIKKILNGVGIENIFSLLELQKADILSIPNPEEFINKLENIKNEITEIIDNKEPISIKDLAINGNTLIEELKIKPGKEIGLIMNTLLELVLENPTLNTKKNLVEKIQNKQY